MNEILKEKTQVETNKDLLTEGKNEKIQIVIFKLGIEEFAIPVNYIQEVILNQKSTRIPKSSPHVVGMINLRGQIIPIMNSKMLVKSYKKELDQDSTQYKKERVLIIKIKDETLGLIVDSVSEVIYINVDDIDSPPVGSDEAAEYVKGIGKYNNRLLVFVDLEKFIQL